MKPNPPATTERNGNGNTPPLPQVDEWPQFRELSEFERTQLACKKLYDRLTECVNHFKTDFPQCPVNDEDMKDLRNLAMLFNRGLVNRGLYNPGLVWTRTQIARNADNPKLAQTHGERFLLLQFKYHQLCFGYRPQKKGDRPGIMRVIREHFDRSDTNDVRGLLCIGSLSGRKIDEFVWNLHERGYTDWNNDRVRTLVNRLIDGTAEPED